MLDNLRKKQKGIIWLIAIIFIAGMAVMGIVDIFLPKPTVGKIYGNKITYQEYDNLYRMTVENYIRNYPNAELDDQMRQNLNDQTWNMLVDQKVIEKQLKRYRIKVKDADIINKILNDPPAELRQNPDFQTDGVFDMDKYLNIVTNYPDFAQSLEAYFRQSLPYEMLEKKIKDQVIVTPDSVRIDWLAKNDRASGRVLWFDWNRVPAQEVTDEEIAAYHKTNGNKYRKEATRKYRYVQMPLAPSNADTMNARNQIYEAYEEVKAGGDFAQIAEQYSQDPGSAANGGSLGYFGRGAMVPEFDETAFRLNIGEISEPFLTRFGYHFLKVTGKRTNEAGEPEVEASHILVMIEISPNTREEIRNTAELLYDMAEKDGLIKAAEELKLQVQETNEFFAEDEYISGIGRNPHLVKEAFSRKLGYLVRPFRSQDGSYLVAELSHREAAHIQPLEQVSEVIRREIDKEKRMAIALQQAEEMMAKYDSQEWFAQTDSLGFRVVNFNEILITRSIPSIGLVRPLNRAIFDAEADQWTDLIAGDNGLYRAFVSSRNKPNMEIFENDYERLANEYRTTKENTHYNEWLQRVKKEAKVEDMRYLYY